ncbi:MAG: hypothetical protein Q9163_001716 [Psora crenata]
MEATSSALHGQKRRAEEELRNEQRLAKRFDLLNLEHNGKLYVPVAAPLATSPATSYSPSIDSMLVDDTKDRIYIHNLDEEIAEIENAEDKPIFLPDIEKKLGKIPKSVLAGDVHPSAGDKQMVVYSVPESLSLPKEKDSVRRAILEVRQRARDRQASEASEAEEAAQGAPSNWQLSPSPIVYGNSNGNIDHSHPMHVEDDDAMDLG